MAPCQVEMTLFDQKSNNPKKGKGGAQPKDGKSPGGVAQWIGNLEAEEGTINKQSTMKYP